jgi:hypothetical protein
VSVALANPDHAHHAELAVFALALRVHEAGQHVGAAPSVELVAARRPTVRTALAALERSGAVSRLPGGWLLCGRPPGELKALTPPEK